MLRDELARLHLPIPCFVAPTVPQKEFHAEAALISSTGGLWAAVLTSRGWHMVSMGGRPDSGEPFEVSYCTACFALESLLVQPGCRLSPGLARRLEQAGLSIGPRQRTAASVAGDRHDRRPDTRQSDRQAPERSQEALRGKAAEPGGRVATAGQRTTGPEYRAR